MCYNGKCLHCLEVETGTQIFAIIQFIFTSIGTLATLGSMVINMSMQKIGPNKFQSPSQDNTFFGYIIKSNTLLGVSLAFTFLALVFSLVLLDGVWHRKAGHVKAYFIYGVLHQLVLIIFGLISLIRNFHAGVLYIFIAICIINVLLLHMIHMTYRKFQAGVVYQDSNNSIKDV